MRNGWRRRMETWMEMVARCWNQDRECERVWKVFCQGARFGAGLNVNMAFARFFFVFYLHYFRFGNYL